MKRTALAIFAALAAGTRRRYQLLKQSVFRVYDTRLPNCEVTLPPEPVNSAH